MSLHAVEGRHASGEQMLERIALDLIDRGVPPNQVMDVVDAAGRLARSLGELGTDPGGAQFLFDVATSSTARDRLAAAVLAWGREIANAEPTNRRSSAVGMVLGPG